MKLLRLALSGLQVPEHIIYIVITDDSNINIVGVLSEIGLADVVCVKL